MKMSYSAGHDGLNSKILKLAAPVISPILSDYINLCFRRETFPDALKVARVIAIHKSGGLNEPSNYRPISILPSISKVFEKVLYHRMLKFTQKERIICDNQFGFRSKRSCVHAIASLTEFIRDKIESKTAGLACFIDLKKAFDTIDHQILITKLEDLGFRGNIGNILRSYLTNRVQYVCNGTTQSQRQSIQYGVPQGSILGPLLFILFINDLPEVVKTSQVTLFADDTALVDGNKVVHKSIQEDLANVEQWCQNNKLFINYDKCQVISFGPSVNNELLMNNEKLMVETSIKYLGLQIDGKLLFDNQVTSVCSKLIKFCGVLYKARCYFSKKILLKWYNVYCKPVIYYGILIYGSADKSKLNKILRLQKRIIRTIYFMRKCEPTRNLFQDLKIETVYDLYFRALLTELMNQLSGRSPLNLLNEPITGMQRVTRASERGELRQPKCRTKAMQKSLKSRMIKLYNFLLRHELLTKGVQNMSLKHSNKLSTDLYQLYLIDNKTLFDNFF